jgi:hypothetical protein
MQGKHLKTREFGNNALGVTLEGNPQKPEPIYFIVEFPGGSVEISRCDDNGDYWVHTRKNMPDDTECINGESLPGKIIDGRQDVSGKHANECNPGELTNPDLYHLAVRIAH